jgi:hypothetical protein
MRGVRDRLSRWLGDPLVHFVALGVVVFAAHRALAPANEEDAPRVIRLEGRYLEALVEERARRTGRAVRDEDRREARSDYVREEALVREARALGLDAGDAIVRRRLVQKLELLVRASLAVPEPTDDELAAYLDAHQSDYLAPADVSFEHRYFSRERRGEAALRDALSAAASPDADTARGDPFPLGARFSHRTRASLTETFGPELAAALDDAPLEAWSSPIETRFGVHLVRVWERRDGRPLSLDEVRERLAARWTEEREQAQLEQALGDIVASYEIEDAP